MDSRLKTIINQTDEATGREFLEKLVISLTQELQLDYAFVGSLEPGGTAVRTLTNARRGELQENFTYALPLTPCSDVLDRQYCHFGEKVCEAYPEDQLLIDMEIEAYIGYPLISSRGEPLGILVCMHSAKVEGHSDVFDLLKFLARRVESEIERDQLTTRLERTESSLKVAERVRGVLLSNVSHELRTPLNAIMGFSQLLQRYDQGDMDYNTLREYLQIIHSSGEDLLDAVTRMMEMSQLESGAYTVNLLRTSVEELIEIKLPVLRRKYPKHKFVQVGSAPNTLLSDQHLLGICIAELIDNAAKHSLPGTTVTISLRPDDDRLHLIVSDDGPGMQPSQVAELFNAFTIAEDYMTKTSGGLGLGLSLVRSASRLLDIEITLDSEEGRGTKCELCIPC